MINNKSNAELLKEFDKHVIGHTDAKKTLISLVNRSKTAHYHKYLSQGRRDIETMNCMLVGGSGTGKTHLVNTLQKIVSFPLIKLDAMSLAPGDNSEGLGASKIKQMIVANAQELVKAHPNTHHSVPGAIDQTIVFIDEIDKLGKSLGSSSKEWNSQVQAALLTLIEDSGKFKNVSFILAGAFVGMRDNFKQKTAIGFFPSTPKTPSTLTTSVDTDVIKYGMIPELIGRLSSITMLDTLTSEVLKTILVKVLLPETVGLFRDGLGMPLPKLSDKQADEMIERSLDSGQGVRFLKREVNKLFMDYEFGFEKRTV